MVEVQNAPLDAIIRNGTVYDGTGQKPRQADVAVVDGKVKEIAPKIQGNAAKEIDAQGRWVMPGFLDIHTHYDAEIEAMPGLEESVRHGVTTVVMGNCSLSTAMGSEEDLLGIFCRVENLPRDLMIKWLGGKITWRSLKEYYDHLETIPMGPNVASFLGHSNIRFEVMGMERSLNEHKPTADEIKKMQNHVRDAVDAGYLGMSIDLLPWHRMASAPYTGISIPSQQARAPEYHALASVLREKDAVLQATPNALNRATVLLLFALSAGFLKKPLKTTIVAALDVKTNPMVYKMATVGAGVFNNLFRADLRFQALAEPFTMFGDGPIIPFLEELPAGVDLIDAEAPRRKELLGDPDFRARFRKDWNSTDAKVFHCDLDDMFVVSSPERDMDGKAIAAVARERSEEPLEFFMDMLEKYDTDFRWKSSAANDREGPRKHLLGHKYTLPGFNDSGAHNRNMGFQDGALQMLRQAKEDPDWITIERAVQRLTSEPADWLGLDAGTLAEGKRADISVIDPERLTDGLGAPVEYVDERIGNMRVVKRSDPVVKQVMIGGKVAYEDGTFSETLGKEKHGQLLRRKS